MIDNNEHCTLVSINCITYNHAKYIRKCLDGFVMQKTNFHFQAVVHDDASTDGTDNIIKEYCEKYPNIFVSILEKENQYSKQKDNINKVMEPYLTGKYIAFCEGDDYWIDPYMLQTCVDFLENNSEYSCVFGNRLTSNEEGNNIKKTFFNNDLTLFDIMSGKNMGLRNLVFRNDVNKVEFNPSNLNLDLILYYKCAVSGKMKYLDKDFSIYRMTGKGIATSRKGKEVFLKSIGDYYLFHQNLEFEFQNALVKYQMKQLLFSIKRKQYFFYCIYLIYKFHIPSKKRWFLYIYYFFNLTLGKFLKRK